MKKLLWIIKLSCFILCSYHGHSCPEDIVKLIPDSSVREELDKNGIMSTFSQQENLYLASKINKELVQIKNTNNTIPIYGSEILRIIPSPFQTCNWVHLYNNLRAISSMKDLKYFSQSREPHRLLYKRSHIIHSPNDLTPKNDPIVSNVPEWDKLYILQEDLTFGNNIYQADYFFDGYSISLHVTNLNTMWWLIFPLIAKEHFQIIITAIPTNIGILFYGVATINALDVPTMREKGQTSLSNRLNALENWLNQRIHNKL